jgi:hypothetical protein
MTRYRCVVHQPTQGWFEGKCAPSDVLELIARAVGDFLVDAAVLGDALLFLESIET